MKNILYSNNTIGGAELYVRNLEQKYSVSFIAIKDIDNKGLWRFIKVLFSEDKLVFHDLRAAMLKFLRPLNKDLVVIHGPGKHPLMLKVLVFLLSMFKVKIVLVSQDLFNNVITIRANKKVYIPNKSSFEGVSLKDDNIEFVYFGRLEPSKGVDKLFSYWKQNSHWPTLNIIGDGSLKNGFLRGLPKNIVVHGAQPQNMIKEIIADKCRFYISLSEREGESLSLKEALSCGLIPLVSRIPSQEFIEEKYQKKLVDIGYGNLETIIEEYLSKENTELVDLSSTVLYSFKEEKKDNSFDSFWELNTKLN